MRWATVGIFLALCFQNGAGLLWPRGVVHFNINNKDYDTHSQDIILSTLEDIEHEICVKFFNIPADFNTTDKRILYITNPDKRKDCPPRVYNFSQPVVDMPIGYKCLDKKNIARIIIDMLRASIEDSEKTMNSYDLIRKFQETKEDPTRPYLINPTDRNYINAHYHAECRSSPRVPAAARRSAGVGDFRLSSENKQYYKDRLWPLGVVMYGVEETLSNSASLTRLKLAMTSVELASCVVFQEVSAEDALRPNNFLWFASDGADTPALGFREGNQSISLSSMVTGAPGHLSHTLNLLLRALGVPMASNRPDRDNHIVVHWNNVMQGKEHYLEQFPAAAWVRDPRLPYDFESATHAPANFACRHCHRGEMTVEPTNDYLWMRALTIGHHTELSAGDRALLDLLYAEPCRDRYNGNQ